MTPLSALIDRDRRLALLRFLRDQDDGHCLSLSLMTLALGQIMRRVYRDTVEADFVLLEQHGLLSIERHPLPDGEMVVATATQLGLDVANGRPHPQFPARRPKE